MFNVINYTLVILYNGLYTSLIQIVFLITLYCNLTCCPLLSCCYILSFIFKDLGKEVTQLSHSNDKLRNAESEIRTLKSFLTSKTAMIEKRKKEIHEVERERGREREKEHATLYAIIFVVT